MGFLKILEGMRFEPLTGFMSLITYLGDETCFMAIALLFFWCVSQKQGYFILVAGLAGNIVNQFLKLWFRIPRPWVLDPGFTIVEAAREGASGYSFPSGHTHTVVSTFGAVFLSRWEKWLRALCAAVIILVPFSRMYLGVHTPLDVGVSFVLAWLFLLILSPQFQRKGKDKGILFTFALLAALSAAYIVFVKSYPFPADTDPHNLTGGTKNAFTLAGSVLGVIVVWFAEKRYIDFDTEAPLVGQVLKFVLGLIVVVAVKSLTKSPLRAVFGDHPGDMLRYFLIVIVSGLVWPLSFPMFKKLGSKPLKKN